MRRVLCLFALLISQLLLIPSIEGWTSILKSYRHVRKLRVAGADLEGKPAPSIEPNRLLELRQKALNALLVPNTSSGAISFSDENLRELESLTAEVSSLLEKERDSKKLLAFYFSMLQDISFTVLDSLQLTTIRNLARSIFRGVTASLDRVSENESEREAAETALVDSINDQHLAFIDRFKYQLETRFFPSPSSLYRGKTASFFVAQLAAILKAVYQEFGLLLNEVFLSSVDELDESTERWVAPLFARLQRKFPEFRSESEAVAGKISESYSDSFEQLVSRFSFEISPRYSFSLPSYFDLRDQLIDNTNNSNITPSHNNSYNNNSYKSNNNKRNRDNVPTTGNSRGLYPAWELARVFSDLLRRALDPSLSDNPEVVEAIVLRKLRDGLIRRLQAISEPLQQIYSERSSYSLQSWEREVLEEGLSLGQDLVAAVYSHWQLSCNILTLGRLNASSDSFERGDLIRPLSSNSFRDKRLLYSSLPLNLSLLLEALVDNEFTMRQKQELQLKPELEGYSLMAQALRIFCNENYQALILRSSSSSDPSAGSSTRTRTSPHRIVADRSDSDSDSDSDSSKKRAGKGREDFDAMYGSLLTQLFFVVLASPHYQDSVFFQLLLGAVALEPAMNVKEPRKMALLAYERAVFFSLDYLHQEIVQTALARDDQEVLLALQRYDLPRRLDEMEQSLHFFLDATASPLLSSSRNSDVREKLDSLFALRFSAFETFVLKLQLQYEERHHSQTGLISFLQKQSEPLLPLLFQREEDLLLARQHLLALGLEQFQQTLSNILSSASLVWSLPEMGQVYLDQLLAQGAEVFSSDAVTLQTVQELSEQYLAVFLEVLVEEARNRNLNRLESLVVNLCRFFRHPLLLSLHNHNHSNDQTEPEQQQREREQELMVASLNLFLSNRPREEALNLVQICERYRQKLLQREKKLLSEQSSGSAASEQDSLFLPKTMEGWGSDSQEIDSLEDIPLLQSFSQRLQQIQLHLLKEMTSRGGLD